MVCAKGWGADYAVIRKQRGQMVKVKQVAAPYALTRNAEDVEVAVWSDDRGTPEFGRRMDVGDDRLVLHGEVRRVRRTVDVLARMYQNRTITAAMVKAGRRFQRVFCDARLDGHGRSSFADGVPTARGRKHGGRGQPMDGVDRALDAREELARAIGVLGGHGSPGAGAAWFVLGEEGAIRDFARRTRWGGGRTITEEVARGVLVAALGVLAGYWGTGALADGR